MLIASHPSWINYVAFPLCIAWILFGALYLLGKWMKEQRLVRQAADGGPRVDPGQRVRAALPDLLLLLAGLAYSVPMAIATYRRMRP